MSQSNKHDFVIADVNGRFNSIIKNEEYKHLCQCTTLEEFVIKINHYLPFINEDMQLTIKDLKMKLFSNILKEYNELQHYNLPVLEYYYDYNLIRMFFSIFQTNNLEANDIDEFKCLLTYKTFKDIEKLCIRGFRLEKFFDGIQINEKIEENDLQKMQAEVFKRYFDFYRSRNIGGYFEEILEIEANRQVIEISCNNPKCKDKRRYFPEASTFSGLIQDKLSQEDCNVSSILKFDSPDPLVEFQIKQAKVYSESFKQYDDISCVYSYLRLKELEARNILWIAECLIQNLTENTTEYILSE